MSRRRVVITGLGTVNPLANDVAVFLSFTPQRQFQIVSAICNGYGIHPERIRVSDGCVDWPQTIGPSTIGLQAEF